MGIPQAFRVYFPNGDSHRLGESESAGWGDFMDAPAMKVDAREAAFVALEVAILAAAFANKLGGSRSGDDAAGAREAFPAFAACQQ